MSKQLEPIVMKNFNQGGLSDSDWSGIANSMAKIVGIDLHSVPGLVQAQQALVKESSTVITGLCKHSVAASDGNNYWFDSESGKVWKESSGTYTLVYTTSPAAGTAYCTGAYEYNNYIYWATQSRLHRIAVSGLSDWNANVSLNWATLTNGAIYHPMLEVNSILFIGDGKDVHQVDNTTFTASALDIKAPHVIKSLGQTSTDLLIGTEISGTTGRAGIYRWDTYSESYLSFDSVPEDAVNAFLMADNFVYVQAGKKGNIYSYNGESLDLYYKIPGTYSSTKYGLVHSGSVANFGGQILFGFSNGSGNPTEQGVYMIGRNSSKYPYVMDMPFPISERSGSDFVLSGIEIGAIITRGYDLWVAWKNGSTCGVDKLSYTTKLNGAYIESRYMIFDRSKLMTISDIILAYNSIPTNCSLTLHTKSNYAASFTAETITADTMRNTYNNLIRRELNVLKVKVSFVTNSNDSPNLESISVILDG